MPAKFADHAIPVTFSMVLNRRANIAQMIARTGLFDPQHQAFISDIDQPPRLQRDIADQIHPAAVAVPSIEQRRDIDVDNIAVFQRLVRRNPVAHHVVDRDAARMRIAPVTHRGGHRAAIQRHRPDQIIKRARGDAGDHVAGQFIEDLRGQPPRCAHSFERGRAVQFDRAVAQLRVAVHYRLILSHAAAIAAKRPIGYAPVP